MRTDEGVAASLPLGLAVPLEVDEEAKSAEDIAAARTPDYS
jgi:hypothetical protein